MTLQEFFASAPKCALGFSGGIDSAYLLYAAHDLSVDIQPYFVKTEFQPQFELDAAQRFCESLGMSLNIISLDVLSKTEIAANPENRCYHCKKTLFTALLAQAEKDGCGLVIDGTNISDDYDERPGMRALAELGVRSPLRECGLTKTEIIQLSKEAGLPQKPSYSCLATRIPRGRQITQELLSRVEAAENAIFKLGFSDFRVRVRGESALLEITNEQIDDALERQEEMARVLAPYFSETTLGLRI